MSTWGQCGGRNIAYKHATKPKPNVHHIDPVQQVHAAALRCPAAARGCQGSQQTMLRLLLRKRREMRPNASRAVEISTSLSRNPARKTSAQEESCQESYEGEKPAGCRDQAGAEGTGTGRSHSCRAGSRQAEGREVTAALTTGKKSVSSPALFTLY